MQKDRCNLRASDLRRQSLGRNDVMSSEPPGSVVNRHKGRHNERTLFCFHRDKDKELFDLRNESFFSEDINPVVR